MEIGKKIGNVFFIRGECVHTAIIADDRQENIGTLQTRLAQIDRLSRLRSRWCITLSQWLFSNSILDTLNFILHYIFPCHRRRLACVYHSIAAQREKKLCEPAELRLEIKIALQYNKKRSSDKLGEQAVSVAGERLSIFTRRKKKIVEQNSHSQRVFFSEKKKHVINFLIRLHVLGRCWLTFSQLSSGKVGTRNIIFPFNFKSPSSWSETREFSWKNSKRKEKGGLWRLTRVFMENPSRTSRVHEEVKKSSEKLLYCEWKKLSRSIWSSEV